jgi:hypothetical protein
MTQDVHVKSNPAAFNRNVSFRQQIGLKHNKKLVKCYILNIEIYGAKI